MLRMRTRAERELGQRFDIRGFHDVLLMNGGMPLDILEDTVDRWIAGRRAD
jgi:uncharacterized protein (DUF885 family)